MTTLGDLLGRDVSTIDRWLAAAAPALHDALACDAAAAGLDAGAFVRELAARFTQHAGPDAWTHLAGALARADDPASACVQAMLDWHRAASAGHARHLSMEEPSHGSHA